MNKSKIAFIASITAVTVGAINGLGAVIAYSMVVPEPVADSQTLIAANSSDVVVPDLPTLVAPIGTVADPDAIETSIAQPEAGSDVVFRSESAQLSSGQAPSPTGVTTSPSGAQVFRWCSGTNPNLPDEVCQAIISIVSNPVESNPHLGQKARQSLSLLPKDTSLTMDESSWQATGVDTGSMVVIAKTPAYGSVRIKIMLEKQNNIWVLIDGQLAA